MSKSALIKKIVDRKIAYLKKSKNVSRLYPRCSTTCTMQE